MFVHPNFNPEVLHIAGPLAIRWYGLAYMMGFVGAWFLGCRRLAKCEGMTKELFSDLVFAIMLGVIVGGRLGYMLFYGFAIIVQNPLKVFYIWEGGMSFHGGLIGVLIQVFFFARRHQFNFFSITDFIAPLIPIGLFFGRAANFINGELWGRVTDVPWAVIFPSVDYLPRHPSQLYEMLTEGLLLFLLLIFVSAKKRTAGCISGTFLICYSLIRFLLEFVRQPDSHLGFIYANWLTMGQLLSVPMFVLGVYLLCQPFFGKSCVASKSL